MRYRRVTWRASMEMVEARNLPGHIGIIMDGNGRWAQTRGEPRAAGHRQGASAVRRTVRVARRLGLRALTLYAFSEQNWARPEEEVDALMQLLRDFLLSEREEIHQMTLTLALSYGGREEIAHAARQLAKAVAAGDLRPEDVTAEALHAQIPSLSVGDPDLVIRTGGERRISNFLLYGLAYAELYFADVLWPDFSERDLFAAIASYQKRQRRYGLVGSHGADGLNGSAEHRSADASLVAAAGPITRIAI
jgi:undecaprenyl diphosphate synthase